MSLIQLIGCNFFAGRCIYKIFSTMHLPLHCLICFCQGCIWWWLFGGLWKCGKGRVKHAMLLLFVKKLGMRNDPGRGSTSPPSLAVWVAGVSREGGGNQLIIYTYFTHYYTLTPSLHGLTTYLLFQPGSHVSEEDQNQFTGHASIEQSKVFREGVV